MEKRRVITIIGIFTLLMGLNWQMGFAKNEPEEQKTFFFAGMEWEADTSLNRRVNPGKNYFSSAEDTVWVDSNGWLHLKIHENAMNKRWVCPSIHSKQPARFGTHRFRVIGHLGSLDKNVVLGLFLYQSNSQHPEQHAEIDYEFSTWGLPMQNSDGEIIYPCSNSQAVLWPSWNGDFSPQPASIHYFFINSSQVNQTTHDLYWSQNRIRFKSYWNHDPSPRDEDLIFSYQADPKKNPNAYFPAEEDEMVVYINLWLNNSAKQPSNEEPVEIMVKYEYLSTDEYP